MADRQALTDEDWTGGFHELALIWPDHDDARLTRATAALWSTTGFTGHRPAGADFHVRGTAPLAVAAAPEERPVGFLLPDRSRVGLRYFLSTR
jgi:hypothetical protein